MKALIRDRYPGGLTDVLEVREIERPVPQPDEVLLRVYAASIKATGTGGCFTMSFTTRTVELGN